MSHSHCAPGPATWPLIEQELARHDAARPACVLDVGGGSGGVAVRIAAGGADVTVVDPSADALATLRRRADDAGVRTGLVGIQGDLESLADVIDGDTRFDLVLCHRVLDLVDDPGAAVRAVAATLRPGGAASIVVANRAAVVLSRAIRGHLEQAIELLTEPTRMPASVAESRLLDTDSLAALLTVAGLHPETMHGVGVFSALMPADRPETDTALLRRLEALAGDRPPYRDIAALLHVLARRS
ncbi:MAG: class I SAM-dependent methyltransferase [Mycobacteriales bacterium]